MPYQNKPSEAKSKKIAICPSGLPYLTHFDIKVMKKHEICIIAIIIAPSSSSLSTLKLVSSKTAPLELSIIGCLQTLTLLPC